jgi:hypothetical protein
MDSIEGMLQEGEVTVAVMAVDTAVVMVVVMVVVVLMVEDTAEAIDNL